MTTIRVPAPPRSAFHKDRPISDLLRGQIKHFEHLELKLPPEQRSDIPLRDRLTENGAARYIAHITNFLRNQAPSVGRPAISLVPPQPAAAPAPAPRFRVARSTPPAVPTPLPAIAAAAAAAPPPEAEAASPAAGKSSPAKRKPASAAKPKRSPAKPRGRKS